MFPRLLGEARTVGKRPAGVEPSALSSASTLAKQTEAMLLTACLSPPGACGSGWAQGQGNQQIQPEELA